MSRVKLINIFEDTLSMCHTNQRLMNSINYSRQHNRVVTDENAAQYLKSLPYGTGKKAEVIVSKKRSFEAASAYKGKRVCVLNFASATNPGGGVKKGSSAQEECLCRTSTLYECLSVNAITHAFHKKHKWALKAGEIDALYNDDCILTRGVTVFKQDAVMPVALPENEWFDVDVISCAAPNLRLLSQRDRDWKKKVTDQMLYEIYQKRIHRILDMARWLESEVMILGAFGCGAFANPPKLVAKAMHAAIEAHIYDFETIELAIYCSPRDTSNYETFAKELNQ